MKLVHEYFFVVWPVLRYFIDKRLIIKVMNLSNLRLLMIDFRIMLAAAVVFAVVWIATRQFSLSGLVAVAASPGIAVPTGHSLLEISGMLFTVLIILYAHRSNLRQMASSLMA